MTFTADKIITDDEIAPAIPVLNFWLNKTYPTYAGRYSASGMVGYNRLIALMIAKMTGQGHFPTGVTLPRNAKQASIDKAVELLKSTSYPEEQPGVLMKDGRVIKKGELKAKWVDWTEVLGYKISRFHSPKTFATDL